MTKVGCATTSTWKPKASSQNLARRPLQLHSNVLHIILLLEEAKKNLLKVSFFLSIPPLANATEESCLFLRLAVCLFVCLKPQSLQVSYLYHVYQTVNE